MVQNSISEERCAQREAFAKEDAEATSNLPSSYICLRAGMQGSRLQRVRSVHLLPQRARRGNLLHAWLASSRLRTNRPQNLSCNKSSYNQMFRSIHIQDRQIHSARATGQSERHSTKRPEKWAWSGQACMQTIYTVTWAASGLPSPT